MANVPIKALRAELESIEREIKRLTEQAEHFRGVIAWYEQQDEAGEELAPAKAVRNTIYEILETEGKPLYYKEIYARLRQRDISVGGQDPAANVISHMSGDERFRNVGRGTWGLRRWKSVVGTDSATASETAAVVTDDGQQGAPPPLPPEPPYPVTDFQRFAGSR